MRKAGTHASALSSSLTNRDTAQKAEKQDTVVEMKPYDFFFYSLYMYLKEKEFCPEQSLMCGLTSVPPFSPVSGSHYNMQGELGSHLDESTSSGLTHDRLSTLLCSPSTNTVMDAMYVANLNTAVSRFMYIIKSQLSKPPQNAQLAFKDTSKENNYCT